MKSALKSFPLGFFPRVAVAISLTILFAVALCGKGNSQTPPSGDAPRVTPNRTLPKVEPPQQGLAFPPDPTPQDFFRARVFEEPLVPIGGEPTPTKMPRWPPRCSATRNAAGRMISPASRAFWKSIPNRRGARRCSRTSASNITTPPITRSRWRRGAKLGRWRKDATDAKGKAIADRAAGELAFMYARLGRMTELEALLKSVEGRGFIGAATERIAGAREGLVEHAEPAGDFVPLRAAGVAVHQAFAQSSGAGGQGDFQFRLDAERFLAAASGGTLEEGWPELSDGVSRPLETWGEGPQDG